MKRRTKEYYDYLQSEAWAIKRRERLHIDGYTCQDCGENQRPLDMHHLTYKRLGNERMSDLLTLCRRCHDYRHGKIMVSVFNCPTCLQFIPITVQRIRMLRHDTMRLKCADGCVRLYDETHDMAKQIKRLLP
jgi:hypothetical protein